MTTNINPAAKPATPTDNELFSLFLETEIEIKVGRRHHVSKPVPDFFSCFDEPEGLDEILERLKDECTDHNYIEDPFDALMMAAIYLRGAADNLNIVMDGFSAFKSKHAAGEIVVGEPVPEAEFIEGGGPTPEPEFVDWTDGDDRHIRGNA